MDAEHARSLALFQRAQAQVTDRVDAVGAGQWDVLARPGRTVVDLVAHLVADQLRVPLLLAGEPTDGVPTDTDLLVAGDPLGSWEAAADAALTAWAQPAAVDRVVQTDDGPTAAAAHLAALTTDLTVHAWDIARATGGDLTVDGALVAAGLAQVEQYRASGPVDPAPPVPAGADPLLRLLTALGRRA